MKRLTLLSLTLAALTAFSSLASADTSGWSPNTRVRHGVRSGQLTRAETMRLRMGRLQIRRLERMAWADGRLTRREALMLQRAKQAQSRAIFRLKHNGRYA